MRFRDDVILTILDKGLLAMLALFLGFWLNTLLKSFESRKAQELEILRSRKAEELQAITQRAIARMPAYRALWACFEVTSPTVTKELTRDEREKLDADLRRWYYREGNGLFLSHAAATMLLEARRDLLNPQVSDGEIRKKMSHLRTQLKEDIRVYGPAERDVEIGIA